MAEKLRTVDVDTVENPRRVVEKPTAITVDAGDEEEECIGNDDDGAPNSPLTIAVRGAARRKHHASTKRRCDDATAAADTNAARLPPCVGITNADTKRDLEAASML